MCRYVKYLPITNLSHLTANLVKNYFSTSVINNNKFLDDDRGFGRAYQWRTLDDAFVEAKKTGKPVFLIMHKSWCPVCQKLKEKISKSTKLLELSERFVMVNVENGVKIFDKQDKHQLDEKYVPRILFFTPDGELIREAYNRNPCCNPKYRYLYQSPDQIVETMLLVIRNRDFVVAPDNSKRNS